MEQRHSLEFSGKSASQEILGVLCRPKVNYLVYKSLSQARSIQSDFSHPTCLTSFLNYTSTDHSILLSHLSLGLSSGFTRIKESPSSALEVKHKTDFTITPFHSYMM
jgi:hypothetical protein